MIRTKPEPVEAPDTQTQEEWYLPSIWQSLRAHRYLLYTLILNIISAPIVLSWWFDVERSAAIGYGIIFAVIIWLVVFARDVSAHYRTEHSRVIITPIGAEDGPAEPESVRPIDEA